MPGVSLGILMASRIRKSIILEGMECNERRTMYIHILVRTLTGRTGT